MGRVSSQVDAKWGISLDTKKHANPPGPVLDGSSQPGDDVDAVTTAPAATCR